MMAGRKWCEYCLLYVEDTAVHPCQSGGAAVACLNMPRLYPTGTTVEISSASPLDNSASAIVDLQTALSAAQQKIAQLEAQIAVAEAALILIASCSDYYGNEPNPIPLYEAQYGPLKPTASDSEERGG